MRTCLVVPPSMVDAHTSTDSNTSSSLLRRVQGNDPQAWLCLTQLYAPIVYSWARQTGLQEADAADVMQETFRVLVARVGAFRNSEPGETFRGWLWTITRNKIRDHFRELTGRPPAVGGTNQRLLLQDVPVKPPDETALGGVSVSESYLSGQLLRTVQAEFEPRTWQAFWQVVVEDRRPADVANDLQLSIGSVYMAKSRVLKRLRQELST
ncbi:RNA polymerase sigma factor RpoE [Anatilimnocola aggregata]|uniref:RNA polymerase sigma factor RpoE n=1 Tax=Anatilimnocola aggregata TaxID=2528021 RepID=A0A517YKC2_9BACT|nr:sigma-70 family RNA polymerase sigma factor [Anatilimnocola aggregata]QDU30660.1 RNA polymerase sigma factor RpoE [Anatilimnocola aggregata]